MRSFLLSLCSWLLIAAGAFLAARGGLDYWDSRRSQQEIADQWKQSESAEDQKLLRAQTADSVESGRIIPSNLSSRSNASTPSAERLKAGSTVARLAIPRLSAVLYIVEGTEDQNLRRGPGHLEGSVLPGQNGNCVIAGHRDTHFNVLRNIQKGDEIQIDRAGHKYLYKVDEMSIITPDNIQCLRPTKDAELNLITCFPFQYVGSAPRRFVVRAKLESPAA